jgi:hypothetical protein
VLKSRFVGRSQYIQNPSLLDCKVYQVSSPDFNFVYTLTADEAGNDLLMTGEDKSYTYYWANDTLNINTPGKEYKLVKTKQ